MDFCSILHGLQIAEYSKKKNFKTVCIASFIITYCISQFGLLFPCVNPLAIVSSFSLICGGYEITWLYGMIELTLYTLLLYLFIRKRIRKVDFLNITDGQAHPIRRNKSSWYGDEVHWIRCISPHLYCRYKLSSSCCKIKTGK